MDALDQARLKEQSSFPTHPPGLPRQSIHRFYNQDKVGFVQAFTTQVRGLSIFSLQVADFRVIEVCSLAAHVAGVERRVGWRAWRRLSRALRVRRRSQSAGWPKGRPLSGRGPQAAGRPRGAPAHLCGGRRQPPVTGPRAAQRPLRRGRGATMINRCRRPRPML